MENAKLWGVLQLFAKKGIILGVLLFMIGVVKAQDPVFSQFYLNKNYLNPANAGYRSNEDNFSANFNSRIQYTNVPGVLATNMLALNYSMVSKNHIGLGLVYFDHVEGEGFLHNSNLAGQVSASFGTKKVFFSTGIQFGIGQKKLDWSRLQFSDQFDPYENGIQNQTGIINQNESSNMFFDAGFGFRSVIHFGSQNQYKKTGKNHLSFSIAMMHANRPEISFFGAQQELQPRFTGALYLHLQSNSNNIYSNKPPKYFSVGMLSDIQQGMQSHTLSFFQDITKEQKNGDKLSNLTVGISLRRQKFLFNDINTDAVIIHLLYNKNRLKIGYSYDMTISSLSNNNSHGTHEIGLQYTFGGRGSKNVRSDRGSNKSKRRTRLNLGKRECPDWGGYTYYYHIPNVGM